MNVTVSREDISTKVEEIRQKCRDLGIVVRLDETLSTTEVSDVTGIGESTLRNYRAGIGRGPKWFKQDNGHVRYPVADLADWILSK